MFEELLIPADDFFTQKNTLGNTRWLHIHGWFVIIKLQDYKWVFSIRTKCYKELCLSSEQINFVKQLEGNQKEVPTCSEAHRKVINIITQLVGQKIWNSYSRQTISDTKAYYSVENIHYNIDCSIPLYLEGHLPLYLQGCSQNWKAYFKGLGLSGFSQQLNGETFSCEKYATKPQAIKATRYAVATNLIQLYNSSHNYQKARHCLKNNIQTFDSSSNDFWWMIFVKPEVDLSHIFSN